MLQGRPGLEAADLGLAQGQPLAEQCLRDTARAVNGIVVRVGAVSPSDPAHVLGGEGFPELLGFPELSRHLGWGEELVPGGALAAGALMVGVVFRQACAAPAVVPPRLPRSHRFPPDPERFRGV